MSFHLFRVSVQALTRTRGRSGLHTAVDQTDAKATV
jgi:hypothetical protein